MKIAYLMYFDHDKANEIAAIVNELTKQDDHVFLMINDAKIRDAVTMTYVQNRHVHISHKQEYAQEGDLSLVRGTLLQMKEAVEDEEDVFDWFINLPEGMLPLTSREKITALLSGQDKDYYYVDEAKSADPATLKKALRYYPYTSVVDFAQKKKFRSRNQHMAAFLNFLGFRRKLEDPLRIGSPWFMLKRSTAEALVEHYAYASTYFKLGWYAEQYVIPMMIRRYLPDAQHVNADLRAIGPGGAWVEDQGPREITREVLEQHPEALFGGSFYHSKNKELFNEVLDRYNSGLTLKNPDQPDNPDKLNKMVDTISKQL